MLVTACGHSTYVIEAGEHRVLVDPVFSSRLASGAICFRPDREFDLATLPPPTLLVLTHGHLDHFDPPSLQPVDRSTRVVVPPDAWLVSEVEALGFTDVVQLGPWQRWSGGGLSLHATPSRFEIDEFGVVFTDTEGGSFWDVADSLVTRNDGARVRAEHGPVALVAAHYQPGNTLVGYQRGVGAAPDQRDDVIEWLEAACLTEPTLVFPAASGVAYAGEHRWANRYSAPYRADGIARLLGERLGAASRAAVVDPGDVLAVRGNQVEHRRQAATFVRTVPAELDGYEPVDTSTLVGLEDPDDRDELVARLEGYLVGTVSPFLQYQLQPDAMLRGLFDHGIVWQLAVHLGDGSRLVYSIDFRQERIALRRRSHDDANYFVHLGGGSLLQVLRGDAGAELFWIAAAARYHEHVLSVRDGRFCAPPHRGWDLFERLPDPLTLSLRRLGI